MAWGPRPASPSCLVFYQKRGRAEPGWRREVEICFRFFQLEVVAYIDVEDFACLCVHVCGLVCVCVCTLKGTVIG